jgi:predicted Zn-dependent peptidase
MKLKTILIYLLIGYGLALHSQTISVKSFQALPMDLTASSLEGKRIDQNGYVAALIKVVTTETGFVFEGGTLGIVDTKQTPGEVWVWVPRAARKITIKHPKLGVLRDYYYPVEIEAERTYEMVLTTAKIETIVKEELRMQYLAFQISPPNATLVVDEKYWDVEADGSAQDYVNFGTYSWRVEAPNYHSDAGRVTVDDPNNAKIVPVTLQPNFGWIEVAGSGNLKDASVYVDNALIGRAPCKSEALKSGKHTVRITKKMYDTYTETVTVADNETTRLIPTLTADFAEVTLTVDADAEIWVNNEKKGVKTWTGQLGKGTYKIECKQGGHETTMISKEITTEMNGQIITLPTPRPIYGSLNVESSPIGATISIDGIEMGKAPKSINEILIGKHELHLMKDGYSDYFETITIRKGERELVKVNLSKAENASNNLQTTIDQTFIDDEDSKVNMPVPFDPNVRRGKLANGMTYYVRHNDRPAGRADFYLAQKVGSILEEDSQRGFSYFLEHMAFKGTVNFPNNKLIKYLHSRGINYGKDIIAETGVDETIYKITNVPTRFSNLVDSCLLILHDWSSFLALEDDAIDKERGVILEELRAKKNSPQRLKNTIIPDLYPNCRYANRIPEGSSEVVANFKCQALRDYYHKWYRPDLQCVIIIGDINVDVVESRIKSIFADIKTPMNPAPRLRFKVNDNETPIVVIASDPEETNYNISVSYKHDIVPNKEKGDMTYWLKGYIDYLVSTMYNNRLEELTHKSNSPIVYGSGYYGNFIISNTKDAWVTSAVTIDKNNIKEALNALLAENKRMQQYGFTESEFERAKANLMKQIESQYDERDKQETSRYFYPILSHFLTNEPLLGIENEYMLLSQILPALPVEAINQYVPELIRNDNIVITVTGPKKNGETLPTKQEILNILCSY